MTKLRSERQRPVPARLALPLVPSGHNGQVTVKDRTVFSYDRRGEEKGLNIQSLSHDFDGILSR